MSGGMWLQNLTGHSFRIRVLGKLIFDPSSKDCVQASWQGRCPSRDNMFLELWDMFWRVCEDTITQRSNINSTGLRHYNGYTYISIHLMEYTRLYVTVYTHIYLFFLAALVGDVSQEHLYKPTKKATHRNHNVEKCVLPGGPFIFSYIWPGAGLERGRPAFTKNTRASVFTTAADAPSQSRSENIEKSLPPIPAKIWKRKNMGMFFKPVLPSPDQ